MAHVPDSPGGPALDKLPDFARFLDLSDYARPAARWLVAALLPTPITPIHLTLTFTTLGLAAAGLFALGGYRNHVAAGLLLLLKSTLDAADGSLARARNRPSRLGRYLDSVCDFLVNVAVFGALALTEASAAGLGWPFVVAAAALLAATLQGSVFNYYYVLQRRLAGGDRTSLLDERQARPYPWDPPRLTAAMQRAYLLIYGWQDRLVAWLDRLAAGPAEAAPPPSLGFLTATTALGLGFQLLIIALFAAFNRPYWALYAFLGPGTLYWGALLVVRARAAGRNNR
jgi:phosphatidylglycerophosphate synthase